MSDTLFEEPPPEGDPVGGAWLPLATRMRPRTLDEFAGQQHLLGETSPIRKAIEEGKLGSVILWAPPGCGKTTLAYLIAKYSNAVLEPRSAATTGVADVRKIAEAARARRKKGGRPTLLILDEIHHFNRTQQDSLLEILEDGTLTMVGVTTENPFFILAPALISRARVLPMKPLDEAEVSELLERAMKDDERGLGRRRLAFDPEAKAHLVRVANGDARLALNTLEAAALLVSDESDKSGGPARTEHPDRAVQSVISVQMAEQVLQRPMPRYDQQGDYHYDTI